MKHYLSRMLYFAITACLFSCGEGKPSKFELEKRAAELYASDVLPYTSVLANNLGSVTWAKKNKRHIRKGKTWLFHSNNGVVAFESLLTFYFPENIRGNNLTEVKTVIVTRSTPEIVGYYGSQSGSDHVDAVRYNQSILFVDVKTMKIVKEIIKDGGSPPSQISYERGSKPKEVSGISFSLDEIVSMARENLL